MGLVRTLRPHMGLMAYFEHSTEVLETRELVVVVGRVEGATYTHIVCGEHGT